MGDGDRRPRTPFAEQPCVEFDSTVAGRGRQGRAQGVGVLLGPGDNWELAKVSEQRRIRMSPGLEGE